MEYKKQPEESNELNESSDYVHRPEVLVVKDNTLIQSRDNIHKEEEEKSNEFKPPKIEKNIGKPFGKPIFDEKNKFSIQENNDYVAPVISIPNNYVPKNPQKVDLPKENEAKVLISGLVLEKKIEEKPSVLLIPKPNIQQPDSKPGSILQPAFPQTKLNFDKDPSLSYAQPPILNNNEALRQPNLYPKKIPINQESSDTNSENDIEILVDNSKKKTFNPPIRFEDNAEEIEIKKVPDRSKPEYNLKPAHIDMSSPVFSLSNNIPSEINTTLYNYNDVKPTITGNLSNSDRSEIPNINPSITYQAPSIVNSLNNRGEPSTPTLPMSGQERGIPYQEKIEFGNRLMAAKDLSSRDAKDINFDVNSNSSDD